MFLETFLGFLQYRNEFNLFLFFSDKKVRIRVSYVCKYALSLRNIWPCFQFFKDVPTCQFRNFFVGVPLFSGEKNSPNCAERSKADFFS